MSASIFSHAPRAVTVPVLGWCFLIGSVAGIAACSSPEPEPDPDEPIFPADWESELVEVRDCRQSIDHDLEFVRLFLSPDAVEQYEQCVKVDSDCSEPFPQGTVFVKPHYDDSECEDQVRLSVASRVDAADEPGADGWRWQQTAGDEIVIDGSPPACISCHSTCEGHYDLRCAMDP